MVVGPWQRGEACHDCYAVVTEMLIMFVACVYGVLEWFECWSVSHMCNITFGGWVGGRTKFVVVSVSLAAGEPVG